MIIDISDDDDDDLEEADLAAPRFRDRIELTISDDSDATNDASMLGESGSDASGDDDDAEGAAGCRRPAETQVPRFADRDIVSISSGDSSHNTVSDDSFEVIGSNILSTSTASNRLVE